MLQNGAAGTPLVSNDQIQGDSEFRAKIEESKKNIQKESEQLASPPKKRGPKGPWKNKPAESATSESPAHVSKAKTPTPDLTSTLKTPILSLSKIPAIEFKCADLAFTEDEAQACAESLNGVIQAFVPHMDDMDPKTAAVFGACATFGSIGFQKWMIYRAHQATLRSPPPTEVQSENKQAQAQSQVDASDYFSRKAI